MKIFLKIIPGLAALFVLCFSGCRRDVPFYSIAGTWNEVKVHNYMDSAHIATEDSFTFAPPYATITLTSDGRYIPSPPLPNPATYTFSDSTLTVFISATGAPRTIKNTVSNLQSRSMTITSRDTLISSGQQVIEEHIFYYTR